MIIPDPLEPDKIAVNEDGEIVFPVKMLIRDDDGRPPSMAEWDDAPIVGWSRGFGQEIEEP